MTPLMTTASVSRTLILTATGKFHTEMRDTGRILHIAHAYSSPSPAAGEVRSSTTDDTTDTHLSQHST